MLDHISLRVTNFDKSREFYVKALAPLGYEVIMEFPKVAGLGEGGKPDFWLTEVPAAPTTVHLAFRAKSRKLVHAFYEAALAAGGTANGEPGKREQYHPSYYGAFVLDPDGHNIEACVHTPE